MITSHPIIAAIFSATGALPTLHALGGALPSTTAAAYAEQPAYPQPPQFAPGSSEVINPMRSSSSTLNMKDAKASMHPNIRPVRRLLVRLKLFATY